MAIVDGAQLMITRSFKTGETTDCAPSLSGVLQIVTMAIQLYEMRKFCFNWEVEFHDVIADDNSFDGLKNMHNWNKTACPSSKVQYQ